MSTKYFDKFKKEIKEGMTLTNNNGISKKFIKTIMEI